MVVLFFLLLIEFVKTQYFSQPIYYYQPPIQQQIPYYQTMPIGASYPELQYQSLPSIPLQYEYHQHPHLVNNYPINYPINVQTTNNLANLLLLRELENSRGGNEFRDREGTFEEPNRLINLPISPNDHSKYISLISDKDNFQVSGCSWDLIQMKCVDGLGLCKGGCRDFAVSTTATLHDCRCVPYGYAALLKLAGKK